MTHHPAILWLLCISTGVSLLAPQTAIPCCTGDNREAAAACCVSCETPTSCDDTECQPLDDEESHHQDRMPAPCHGSCVAMCCAKVLYSTHTELSAHVSEDSQRIESISDSMPLCDFCESIFHPPRI